jgi:hypothetical protein
MASAFSEADGIDYTDPEEVSHFELIRSMSNLVPSYLMSYFSVCEA